MSGRVVVIGGGIVGLSAAYYAARDGYHVTVLDREAEGYANASLGNAGMVVPSHFTPLAAPGMVAYACGRILQPDGPFGMRLSAKLVRWGLLFASACRADRCEAAKPILAKLNLLSSEAYGELATELDDFGLTRKGLVMLCRTQHALDEESILAMEAPRMGMEAHVLNRNDLASLDPDIEMDVTGGVYFPSDSHLSPVRLLPAMRKALQAKGVEFHWGADATGFDLDGRKVVAVRSATEIFPADEVVLACGAWSEGVAKELGLNIPVAPGKGYHVDLASPSQMPSLCSILVEDRVAVTPMPHGLRVAGTMELGADDLQVNPRRIAGIRSALARVFPKLKDDAQGGSPVWTGLRPCSPDGLPYLGRSSRWDNVIVATGHSMMGLSLGPISGKIVADLLTARPLPLDLSLLSVDRYA